MARPSKALLVLAGGLALGIPVSACVGNRSGTAAGSVAGFLIVGGSVLWCAKLVRDDLRERAELAAAQDMPLLQEPVDFS